MPHIIVCGKYKTPKVYIALMVAFFEKMLFYRPQWADRATPVDHIISLKMTVLYHILHKWLWNVLWLIEDFQISA